MMCWLRIAQQLAPAQRQPELDPVLDAVHATPRELLDARHPVAQRVAVAEERARGGNGEELLRSLEAFLEHHGNWEAAARALFCHRHTLRYRMSRVEELTGRRMDRVENRIEFWLALRGRELLGDPQPTHH